MSCAVGVAVLRYILDNGLIQNAATVGQYFKERLRDLAQRHEMVGDVRGLGLLLGVEFVRNRATKEPFPAAWRVSTRIGSATLARGLVSYPGAGTADGVAGDHLLYAPPLIVNQDQVDEMVLILDESLSAVAADLLAVQT
jgi:adenosylmethionine-8-amino-7-oxononanoate aminotransferase